ncbi:Putative DD37D maT transposase [Caligus rogercresseyi]|uniref:DD37D maT transposase n=1 Tax=Caligus rogercresseyi TaxID=217165 RepID=A0A7T8JX93_CALRO|nr:Putative DD37D maT transposase [Caligus rogercresseyi]
MNKPLIRGRKIIQQLSKDRSPSVLWTDEKIFTVQAINNSQNDRILTWKKEDISVELSPAFRRQKPPSVVVWAGVTSDGKRAL